MIIEPSPSTILTLEQMQSLKTFSKLPWPTATLYLSGNSHVCLYPSALAAIRFRQF